METLQSYLDVLGSGSADGELVANLPQLGLLVIEPFIPLDDTGFHTIQGTKGPGTEHFVAPIVKRPDSNTFGSMITIGRAGNNDLVIRYSAISKFHAYLMKKTGVLYLYDSGSSNGTWVEGDQLEALKPRAIKNGEEIRLSDLRIVYYTREGFVAYLKELAARRPV